MNKLEETGKHFTEIANCHGLKDLTTDEIKWVIKLMQCTRNDALKESENKTQVANLGESTKETSGIIATSLNNLSDNQKGN